MNKNTPKLQIIDEITKRIHQNVNNDIAPVISKFVNKFLSTVAFDDLEEHRLLDLYGAILSFWNYIYQRNPNQVKIRIYNPEFEKYGWESKHTIVEVLYEDIPFLVDSIIMAINKMGLYSHLIIHSGDMKFIRDNENRIVDVLDYSDKVNGSKTFREAPIFIEINKQTDLNIISELKKTILETIHDVSSAVQDWSLMNKQVDSSIQNLKSVHKKSTDDEILESAEFLEWLLQDHFTLLGIRNSIFSQKNYSDKDRKTNNNFGVLKSKKGKDISDDILYGMDRVQEKLDRSNQPIIISKTNTISNIHRSTYMDYIAIKIYDDKGNVIGQRKIVGLFTSTVYFSNPMMIPLIRNKIGNIFIKSKRRPDSHAGKILRNILDSLPRDDLFQGSEDALLGLAKNISYFQERKKIKFLVRSDPFEKYVSCFVFVPREKFNTSIRETFQSILSKSFNANDIQYSMYFSDSILTRINFIIRVDDCEKLNIDIKKIEKKLIDASREWTDVLYVNLLEHFSEERGNRLYNIYEKAFPLSYQEDHSATDAVYDIVHMSKLCPGNSLELNLYKPVDDFSGMIKFKIFHLNNTIPLSEVVPILENMGLRVIFERPHKIIRNDKSIVWLSDFGLEPQKECKMNLLAMKEMFQECFHRVWCCKVENDKFNNLILNPVLNSHEISMLRAYSKYLQQTRFTFSQQYIEQVVSLYPLIISKIMKLFHIRFDPNIERNDSEVQKLHDNIVVDLDAVSNIDEDRILRRYLELIMVTLRTNFYQRTEKGDYKECISFKINAKELSDLPLPKPMYEIFVYSPKFEGIHLRSSKVARGGIRWSDRKEDFRTEILGLMKAQVVKNSVIVPSGAKGGFVLKKPSTNSTKEEISSEGLECYKYFISALLDITDNKEKNVIISPKNVISYDNQDPYLVVAADKGTATFSDIANQISQDYKFWLGDAFASGGSTGYDHKKMGITARGAWESVKRHFRDLGINIQKSSFTVVGIGDMSGDVFGNGMLLSKKIKLIAAFNHLHIFIDPSPDPEVSYLERKRLFETPGSTWEDYNRSLISSGGGVYNRSDKFITLSPEAKKILDIDDLRLSTNDLIKKVLQAPIDLLWNGGIGTYVKSSKENNASVDDKSNDGTRINANQLRCKIIGEGGNLGLTQLARVEYNLAGGLVYTDFIDNSAGVDCSDHEVNIKILLNDIIMSGDMTLKQRNILLKSMTEEISKLVLKNNSKQTQVISLISQHAYLNLDLHMRYINDLENSKKINRQVENLPSNDVLQERKQEGKGLTAPGISVLLACSKNLLSEDILNSELSDDKFCAKILLDFFPTPIRKLYSKFVFSHSLRKEIISTRLSNTIVNEVGFTFIHRLKDETGSTPSEISKAYLVAREIFNCEIIRRKIDELDNIISPEIQNEILMQLIRLMRRATRWILRNHRENFQINDLITLYTAKISESIELFAGVLQGYDLESYNTKLAHYTNLKLPEDMASYFSMSRALHSSLDCVDAAINFDLPVKDVVKIYFELGDAIELSWIRSKIISSKVHNSWDALTREALRDDLDWQQKRLVVAILSKSIKTNANYSITDWKKEYSSLVKRWEQIVREVKEQPKTDFTIFFVAIRELLDLTQACSIELPELTKIK
jgi:glutamate dehydrogenase